MWGRYWKKMHNIFFIYIHHRVPNEHMMTINFDTITNNYMKLFMWSKLMKYYLKIIDTSFHQRSLISVFQIWFNVYLLTSYMTRFGLWIFMSKSTHDFWLCIFIFFLFIFFFFRFVLFVCFLFVCLLFFGLFSMFLSCHLCPFVFVFYLCCILVSTHAYIV